MQAVVYIEVICFVCWRTSIQLALALSGMHMHFIPGDCVHRSRCASRRGIREKNPREHFDGSMLAVDKRAMRRRRAMGREYVCGLQRLVRTRIANDFSTVLFFSSHNFILNLLTSLNHNMNKRHGGCVLRC